MNQFLHSVPHLATANNTALYTIEKKLIAEHNTIEAWLDAQFALTPPPPYCSVDLRNAGFKLVPVDTNLFSAGFNNIHPDLLIYAIQAAKEMVLSYSSTCQRILLIPENHTRNLFYLENLAVLQHIFQQAGFIVRIGTLLAELTQVVTIDLPSGKKITLEPIIAEAQEIKLVDFYPDMILLNNDLAEGIPNILQNISQKILPSLKMGWHARLKSQHFKHYADIANEFAKIIQLDPWFINALFDSCDEVDFVEQKGEDILKEKITQLMTEIKEKYAAHEIKQQPYVVVKADAGSYGLGVMTVHDAEQISQLNRKQRAKMATTKGKQEVKRVLIQEGVYTAEKWGEDNAVAEPVIYMIGKKVIGGFYRIHQQRGDDENLNSPGMHFAPLEFVHACHCPEKKLQTQECNNRFYAYGVIARLALLAAAREIKEAGNG